MSSRIGVPLLNRIGQRLCRLKEHLFQFLIEPSIIERNGNLIGQGDEKGKIFLTKILLFLLIDRLQDSDYLYLLTSSQAIENYPRVPEWPLAKINTSILLFKGDSLRTRG